jgi:hypothetical protein
MNTGLYRLEFARLGATGRLFSGKFRGYEHYRLAVAGLALILAALGGWMMMPSGPGAPEVVDEAASEPVRLETAAASATASVQEGSAPPQETTSEGAGLDGLSISSQRWRRGGLGSKALVTFTLRNRNEYAVKDIEIHCAFGRRDGSYVTSRTRIIHETVKMRSRKTFSSIHIGYVNVNADRARCSLVNASAI